MKVQVQNLKGALEVALLTTGFLLILVSSVCLTSCKKDDELSIDLLETKGMLSISTSILDEVSVTVGRTETVVTDNFDVTIYNSSDVAVTTYANVTDVPAQVELDAGTYYVVIESDAVTLPAFSAPSYYGRSSNVVVSSGATTNASVEISLNSVKVGITFSTEVVTQYSDIQAVVLDPVTSTSLTFANTETRFGYFNAGNLQLTISATGETDDVVALDGATANDYYNITIGLNSAASGISVSTSVLSETEKLVTANFPSGGVSTPVIYSGDLQVNTQAEIDAITESYTEISNDLIIGTSAATNDITDLSKFASLTKVGGRMFIQRCPNLTSLSGLQNITSVGLEEGINLGELVIREMDALTSLAGLEGLTEVADDVAILDNDVLANLDGLANLASIGNRLWVGIEGWNGCSTGTIKPNPLLTDLCGLTTLITNETVAGLEAGGSCISNDDGTGYFSPSFQNILDGTCRQ